MEMRKREAEIQTFLGKLGENFMCEKKMSLFFSSIFLLGDRTMDRKEKTTMMMMVFSDVYKRGKEQEGTMSFQSTAAHKIKI